MVVELIFTAVKTSSSHKLSSPLTPHVFKNHVNIQLPCKRTSFKVASSIKTYAQAWEASRKSLLKVCGVVNNIKVKMLRIIAVSVVLYEYEAWSHTLREEHMLRVFENS
jgi:hypothetical protein